jgi:hypothetical protein
MMSSERVSVVIPTYNRRDALPHALAPLLADPAVPEVIVVVDGARDGSLELVQDMARREPRLRALWIENRGISGARLAGAEVATGEVVVMLDDDVIAGPGLVTGHARRHANRRRLVVVGYMPVSLPRRRRPEDFAVEFYARAYERHCAAWERDPDSVLRTLWAGNTSMRREDCLRLRERVPQVVHGYHEDLDFGLHCLELGLHGCFDRSLRAEHRYTRAPSAFASDARSSGRNLVRVHARHAGVLGPLEPRFAEAGLPAPLRLLVRVSRRRPRPRRLVGTAVRAFGVARAYSLQRYAAGLLWRMEQQRAAATAGATD